MTKEDVRWLKDLALNANSIFIRIGDRNISLEELSFEEGMKWVVKWAAARQELRKEDI